MLGHALSWLDTAQRCFADDFGLLTRGLLTSIFAPLVGLERIWHLDDMQDQGFAVLTGGYRCPSRHAVGAWRRHLPWYAVDTFCRRTSPWQLIRGDQVLVSYDEHTIPRWTHKFHIKKGYVTTRNKRMRCEKLFFSYDLMHQRYLDVRATPGDWGLMDLAVPLVQRTLQQGRPDYLHALFDAGAGASDAGVRALMDLAREETPYLDVTVRACRYPHRMRAWKALERTQFVARQEPGAYQGAPPKEIRLAETSTVLKDETAEQAVRTILCRELVPRPKKDRWHALFTSTEVLPEDVLVMFRARQYHEQSYRVEVHDAQLDAVPCGYDKESPNPKRPRFHRGPLQMMGWLLALVYNAVGDWATRLTGEYAGSHLGTLRRRFFSRPGRLYETPQALIVQMDRFQGQEALLPVIDDFNAARHRLPWLGNRQVVVSLTPQSQHQHNGP
jgi:hypothetical protein